MIDGRGRSLSVGSHRRQNHAAIHASGDLQAERGTVESPADEPNSGPQISNLAGTDHASIHGYHGGGSASAFQFLTQAVHRPGQAYIRWISAHEETEPPPPRLEFPHPVR